MDVTQRFSDKAGDYVRYRPGYPPVLLKHLQEHCGLSSTDAIADIGSGTGALAELFLERGHTVYCVEPNREMRLSAESRFSGRKGFVSVDGRAEATGLPERSVDMIVAGQAFHWFDPRGSLLEFRRIMRNDGFVVVVRNERDDSESRFMQAYAKLLESYSIDYGEVDLLYVKAREALHGFFSPRTRLHAEFSNSQALDLEGLQGRYLSSSYALSPSDPRFSEAMAALRDLFLAHREGGSVIMRYATTVDVGRTGEGAAPRPSQAPVASRRPALPAQPTQIRALLYDFDDTLVESERINDVLFADYLEGELGVHLSVEDMEVLYGFAWGDVFTYLKERYPRFSSKEAIWREFMRTKEQYFASHSLRAASGIERMLALPLPKAIVSGSTRAEVDLMARNAGIDLSAFDLVVTDDDCRRGKPDPEGFLRALERLRVRPRETLAFEDSAPGIEAARRAGIPAAFMREFAMRDNSAMADIRFDSFEHARPWVKERISARASPLSSSALTARGRQLS